MKYDNKKWRAVISLALAICGFVLMLGSSQILKDVDEKVAASITMISYSFLCFFLADYMIFTIMSDRIKALEKKRKNINDGEH